jgi:hypothetical protein
MVLDISFCGLKMTCFAGYSALLGSIPYTTNKKLKA